MKKSYVRQYDDYSCGPVAIYNALIALDSPPDSIRWIRKECDPQPGHGTLFENMDRAIRNNLPVGVSCDYIRHPSFDVIKNHIKKGGVAIICEHWEETNQCTGEHYYTIIGMDGNNFLTTNSDDTRKRVQIGDHQGHVRVMNPRKLRTSLLQHRLEFPEDSDHEWTEEDLHYPTAWLLSKSRKRKREEEDNDDASSSCCIT